MGGAETPRRRKFPVVIYGPFELDDLQNFGKDIHSLGPPARCSAICAGRGSKRFP
jgi:hypothetical protein